MVSAGCAGLLGVLQALTPVIGHRSGWTLALSITTAALAMATGVTAGILKLIELADHRHEQRERENLAGRLRRSQEIREANAQNRLVQSLLAIPLVQGQLPRLSQVRDADLGPTETRYTEAGDAPYVRRPAIDAKLKEAMGTTGPPYAFVMVVGRSKAGKSRTAVQAAREAFALDDPPVVVPVNGEALAELAALGPPLAVGSRPALVWLDDLTTSDLQHLTASVVHRVRAWAVIVATMTASRADAIERSTTDVAKTARVALRQRTRFYLPFDLTDSEREQARRLYPNETITASLGETLAGARELLRKYDAGAETNPAGYAIVQAAIDIRRAGIARAVREVELRQLFPIYLRASRPDLDPTARQFALGLKWARQPIASHVALLRRPSEPTHDNEGDDRLEPFDYVVDADDGGHDHQVRAVPQVLWDELTGLVSPPDVFSVGVSAELRGQPKAAISAYRRAMEFGHTAAGPAAAFNLGRLLGGQGDVDEAEDAYRYAASSDHPDAAPLAANNLGRLLRGKGRIEEAKDAYQRAIGSDHAEARLLAMFNLAVLLADHGDLELAKVQYQRLTESGNSEHAAKAHVNLASLLRKQGKDHDIREAMSAYERAIETGHPDVVPVAAFTLGELLVQADDVEGAKNAYERAIDTGDPDIAPRAANNLGFLLIGRLRYSEAKAPLQLAARSADQITSLAAQINLAGVLEKEGDVDGAKATYQRVIESGYRDAAATALIALGAMLDKAGSVDAAKDAYERAVATEHPDAASIASIHLGELSEQHGAFDQAANRYRAVMENGNPRHAPKAALRLGLLLEKHGDLDGALAAYTSAIDSRHAGAAPPAAFNVGRMLFTKRGDIEGAKTYFHIAINSGYPDEGPMAAWALGVLLHAQGDIIEATAAYRLAVDSGHEEAAPLAQYQLDHLEDSDTGEPRLSNE